MHLPTSLRILALDWFVLNRIHKKLQLLTKSSSNRDRKRYSVQNNYNFPKIRNITFTRVCSFLCFSIISLVSSKSLVNALPHFDVDICFVITPCLCSTSCGLCPLSLSLSLYDYIYKYTCMNPNKLTITYTLLHAISNILRLATNYI